MGENLVEEDVYLIPVNYSEMKKNIEEGKESCLIFKIIGFCKVQNQFCFKSINLLYNVEFNIPVENLNLNFYKLVSESEFLADKLIGKY